MLLDADENSLLLTDATHVSADGRTRTPADGHVIVPRETILFCQKG